MDNLTKLMQKLSLRETKPTDDKEINILQNLLGKMTLNNNDDVSGLIDQMQSLKINETIDDCAEMEITLNDNTIIKIFVPCNIQYKEQMETMHLINCF